MANKVVKKSKVKNYSVTEKGDLVMQKFGNYTNDPALSGTIAYQVDAGDISDLLYPSNLTVVQVGDLLWGGNANGYGNGSGPNFSASDIQFMGLQFEFPNNGIAGEITINRVYYINGLNVFFKFAPDASLMQKLGQTTIHDIGLVQPFGQQEYNNLGNQNNTKNYTYLDFFPTDHSANPIHLVYFSKDQLAHMAEYYKATGGWLIITGCQIHPGRKLTHRDGDKKIFNDVYFSLKVEGLEGCVPYTGNDKEGCNFIAGLDIAFGHPCPEKWYAFSALFKEACKKDASMNTEIAYHNWERFVVAPNVKSSNCNPTVGKEIVKAK